MITNKDKQKQAVFLRTKIEEMGLSDICKKLGRNRFESITKNDEDPMFVTLITGHEGVSSGRLVSGQNSGAPAKKIWSRDRISELVSKLSSNVPVFKGHPSGKSGREPVGEIVRSYERWEDKKMGAATTAYIKDPEARSKIRSGEIDTCSIEAEIECHKSQGGGAWVVDMIRKVTGVALGNSRTLTPGFPGAMVLAAVEEFDEQPDTDGLEKKLEEQENRIVELQNEIESIKHGQDIETENNGTGETTGEIPDKRNISPDEKQAVLNEASNNLPEGLEDIESKVREIVQKELGKIDGLRAVWKKQRIKTPPEKEGGKGPSDNPLIPRTPGW